MMKYFSLILAFFPLVTSYGCSSGLKSVDQNYIELANKHTPQNNLASLYVYREWKFGGSLVRADFYIDGKLGAQIGTNEFTLFTLTPGSFKYAFTAGVFAPEYQSINVEGGHVYYMECNAASRGCKKLTKELGSNLINNSSGSLVEPLIREFHNEAYIAYQKAEKINTESSYKQYIKNNPNSKYVVQAKRKLKKSRRKMKKKEEKRITALRRSQKCKLKDRDWIYLGASCKGNYANGKGTAVHKNGELSFEGVIKQGKRVKGILSYKNVPLFDGKIVKGKADGKGICFHEGEPEECKYYKGKRVDTLYKQRIEMAKQAKKMEKMERNMNKKMDAIKASQVYGQAAGQNNVVGNAIGKELGKEIGNMIFDQLF